MIDQAKADAKQIMAEARKDIADRLVRREALAEARIARAEAEATASGGAFHLGDIRQLIRLCR